MFQVKLFPWGSVAGLFSAPRKMGVTRTFPRAFVRGTAPIVAENTVDFRLRGNKRAKIGARFGAFRAGHSQYAAKGLKPEGIGQPRQEFIGAVMDNDAFRDGAAQSRHSLGEPLRDVAGMQRQIGMARTGSPPGYRARVGAGS